MNRLAKGMRVMCGLLLLLHLVVFFLPVTYIERENSAGKSELTYSQFDYMAGMANSELPHDEYLVVGDFEGNCYVIVAGFMMVPVLCSLIGGIYGISGGQRQIASGICSLATFGCYLAQFLMLEQVWPVDLPDISCSRAIGSWLSLAVSGLACLTGILTFVFMPRRKGTPLKEIPQVKEIKQESWQAAYHVADLPAGTSARGVMVGVTGMYAGAEIPFEANERHVSRRHCEITWHALHKQFSIKDFSSSGSYINGSEDCLPQNIDTPLPPGTILDIGDENNRFRLE